MLTLACWYLNLPLSRKKVYSIHMYNTFTLAYWRSVFPHPQNVYTLYTHVYTLTLACWYLDLPLSRKHVYSTTSTVSTHVQHIYTHILTLSFPLSTKCVYTTCMQHSHTPTYAMTQFSSFHKTYTLYTHATHSHSNLHTDTYTFPLSAKCAYTIRMYSFPLSTKHTLHYTHMHIPTYTPTLTVFLFQQNIYTIHACSTFTLQLTHRHIQFSSFRKMCIQYTYVHAFRPTHQHLQFSSFHKTYITLYTHATHSHSNLHTNTYSFPLATQCVSFHSLHRALTKEIDNIDNLLFWLFLLCFCFRFCLGRHVGDKGIQTSLFGRLILICLEQQKGTHINLKKLAFSKHTHLALITGHRSCPHLLRTKKYTHQFKETSLLQTQAPSANNRS